MGDWPAPRLVAVGLWLFGAVAAAVGGTFVAAACMRMTIAAAAGGTDEHLHAAAAMPIPVIDFGMFRSGPAIAATIVTVAVVGELCRRATVPLAELARSRLAAVLACQVVALALLATFTITLNPDPYAYAIYGRLAGVHGINPYHIPSVGAWLADPVLQPALRLWGSPPPNDDYGPLWTVLAALVGRAAGATSLTVQFLLERALAAAALCAATVAIFRIFALERAPDGLRRAGFVAFAPLVLLETALNGHNDILMVACAVWAFALAANPLSAGLLLGASIGFKYVSIVAAPFLFVRIAMRHGVRAAALAAGAAVAVLAAAFAPWWIGPQLFRSFSNVAILEYSVPRLTSFVVSSVLRHAGHGYGAVSALVTTAFVVAFVGFVAFQLRAYAARRGNDRAPLWRSLLALFAAMPALGPYYFIWLLPLLAERGIWGTYAQALFASVLFYYVTLTWPYDSIRGGCSFAFVILVLPPLITAAVRAASRYASSRFAVVAPSSPT